MPSLSQESRHRSIANVPLFGADRREPKDLGNERSRGSEILKR